jgi:hypothetical protein
MTILFLQANGDFVKIAATAEGAAQRLTLAGLTPSVFGWILATGFWDDLGVWEDTATWND